MCCWASELGSRMIGVLIFFRPKKLFICNCYVSLPFPCSNNFWHQKKKDTESFQCVPENNFLLWNNILENSKNIVKTENINKGKTWKNDLNKIKLVIIRISRNNYPSLIKIIDSHYLMLLLIGLTFWHSWWFSLFFFLEQHCCIKQYWWLKQ